jgi:hypothetical protein
MRAQEGQMTTTGITYVQVMGLRGWIELTAEDLNAQPRFAGIVQSAVLGVPRCCPVKIGRDDESRTRSQNGATDHDRSDNRLDTTYEKDAVLIAQLRR